MSSSGGGMELGGPSGGMELGGPSEVHFFFILFMLVYVNFEEIENLKLTRPHINY